MKPQNDVQIDDESDCVVIEEIANDSNDNKHVKALASIENSQLCK